MVIHASGRGAGGKGVVVPGRWAGSGRGRLRWRGKVGKPGSGRLHSNMAGHRSQGGHVPSGQEVIFFSVWVRSLSRRREGFAFFSKMSSTCIILSFCIRSRYALKECTFFLLLFECDFINAVRHIWNACFFFFYYFMNVTLSMLSRHT